jgi:imidazolonepropionase-like amidohydrolase
MPNMEAIQSATLNGALLMGIEDKLGSLEAGKLADIIAVRGNPDQDIKALKEVFFVMKEGKVYKQ